MQRRTALLALPTLALAGGVFWPRRAHAAPAWANDNGNDAHGDWGEVILGEQRIRFRWIPAGSFVMGSPQEEEGRNEDEGPQQQVTFARGFWMMEACVSQAIYESVTGNNPSAFRGAQLPVETVSFEEAEAFNRLLSDRLAGLSLRLPSESEWEYACRAGSDTPFSREVARAFDGRSVTSAEVNYRAQAPYLPELVQGSEQKWRDITVEVKDAGFHPNAWGLWHMHGNVFEWCQDTKNDSLAELPLDRSPFIQEGKPARAVRGGAWNIYGRRCRSAARGFLFGAFPHVGFRSVVEW
jgi:formylglycine-generating enzyme required for sulfatase activity